MPKLVMIVQDPNNLKWDYELGDASLMTDLMRGVMPEIHYRAEAPLVGLLTFTFKVEDVEAQTTVPAENAAQPTLDEADEDGGYDNLDADEYEVEPYETETA